MQHQYSKKQYSMFKMWNLRWGNCKIWPTLNKTCACPQISVRSSSTRPVCYLLKYSEHRDTKWSFPKRLVPWDGNFTMRWGNAFFPNAGVRELHSVHTIALKSLAILMLQASETIDSSVLSIVCENVCIAMQMYYDFTQWVNTSQCEQNVCIHLFKQSSVRVSNC